MKQKYNFEFKNQFSPIYIEPLFLRLQVDVWYRKSDVVGFLNEMNPELSGKEIVSANILIWNSLRLIEQQKLNKTKIEFKLTPLGKIIQEYYGIQKSLFLDLFHFLIISTYDRFPSPYYGRFWVYKKVCRYLYSMGKENISTSELTGILRAEAIETFPDVQPKFPERSVMSIYPWLQALSPPFLKKEGTSLITQKRETCSPQLLHLTIDFIYTQKGIPYGSPLALTPEVLENACQICLIDEKAFFPVLNQAKMMLKGISILPGQFNTSVVLEHAPTWITLPSPSTTDDELLEEEE